MKNRTNSVGKLAFAFAIGFLLGILFAPNRGKETRRKLRRELIDILEYLLKKRI